MIDVAFDPSSAGEAMADMKNRAKAASMEMAADVAGDIAGDMMDNLKDMLPDGVELGGEQQRVAKINPGYFTFSRMPTP